MRLRRMLTLGVEEEFFAVDPATGGVLDDGRPVLRGARAAAGDAGRERYSDELRMCTLESKTGVCEDLGQVREELAEMRAVLIAAARGEGAEIAAAGTFPLTDWRALAFTPKQRNEEVAARYGQLAQEHVICASHVHVGVEGRDAAIEVINRLRPWLPVLLALSASSPFWMGEDTGYASYRSMVWERWPMAGIPPRFTSYADYQRTNELLIDSQTSFDAGQVHWDVRPGVSVETVEFRIADACTTIDETMVQAGLSRALVRATLDEMERGHPGVQLPEVLLRAAKWRGARFGLGNALIDPRDGRLVAAPALLNALLEHVRPALVQAGDWEEVTALIAATAGSSSAERQRRAFARRGQLADVAALLIEETGAR